MDIEVVLIATLVTYSKPIEEYAQTISLSFLESLGS